MSKHSTRDKPAYQIYNDQAGMQYCMAYNAVKGTIITGLGPLAIRNLVDIVQKDFVITLKYFDQSERVLEVSNFHQATLVIGFMMKAVTEYNVSVLRDFYMDCSSLYVTRLRDDVKCLYLIEWQPKESTDANRTIYHGVHVQTDTGKLKYAFQTQVGKSTFFVSHVN